MADTFRFSLRVYWEDTDAGGVVYYANYLKFFERARTEWLRSLGFGQEALRTSAGIAFVYCSSKRMKPCEAAFHSALEADPGLTLSKAEAGHPSWGPVWRRVSAARP